MVCRTLEEFYRSMSPEELLEEYYSGLFSTANATLGLIDGNGKAPGRDSVMLLESAVDNAISAQSLFEKGSGGYVFIAQSSGDIKRYMDSFPPIKAVLDQITIRSCNCADILHESGAIPQILNVPSGAITEAKAIVDNIKNKLGYGQN